MPEYDAAIARLEVQLENLQAHFAREVAQFRTELKSVVDEQKAHGAQLIYLDKLTAIGRAFTGAAMFLSGLAGWAFSQWQTWRGGR